MNSTASSARSVFRKSLIIILAIAAVITLTLVLAGCKRERNGAKNTAPAPTTYYSPSSVSVADDGSVYVADATANTVSCFNADGTFVNSYDCRESVHKVLFADGSVYALSGSLGGTLHILGSDLSQKKTVKVGHTPSDIAVCGGNAYICNRFDNTVSVVDIAGARVSKTVPVGREPVCITRAGDELYVGCFLPSNAATDEVVSSSVSVISLSDNSNLGEIRLVNGAQSVRSICASPDGKSVVVTHIVARYTYPTTQVDRGWINTNGFTVIDADSHETVAFLLDEVEKGAANPWDVCYSDDASELYFSLSGTHEIMSVDMEKLNTKLEKVKSGLDDDCAGTENIVDCISFLAGTQKRLRLSGNGVRDIEISGGKLYAAQYFTGTVAVVSLPGLTESACFDAVPAGKAQPEWEKARSGEAFWCDATYAYQGWESCSSCHPEGRSGALNWDELGDGIGNSKNTKSILFSYRTPPETNIGNGPSAENSVRESIISPHYNTVGEDIAEAVDAYLRSMLPIESPYLNDDGTLTDAALRGKELFGEAGCAVCHPAPLYTDMKRHKSPFIGTDGSWEDREMDTPTLVELWRSAPYTFCGGVVDVEDIIKKFAPDLDAGKRADLKEYILSIGLSGEQYGVVETFAETDGDLHIAKLLPSSTLKTFSVIKQDPDANDCTITVRIVDGKGSELLTKTFEPGGMTYGCVTVIDAGIQIPDVIGSGGFLEITFSDSDGYALATPYRLLSDE